MRQGEELKEIKIFIFTHQFQKEQYIVYFTTLGTGWLNYKLKNKWNGINVFNASAVSLKRKKKKENEFLMLV